MKMEYCRLPTEPTMAVSNRRAVSIYSTIVYRIYGNSAAGYAQHSKRKLGLVVVARPRP
jgi:hypothetical protein